MDMKNKATVETLMAYEYEIVFKKKKDKFVFMIPDLFLIASDPDLEAAYRELMAKKEAFFNQMLEDGDHDMIPEPSYHGMWKKGGLPVLKPFAIKAILVLVIMSLIGVVGGYMLKQTVTVAISSISDRLSPANLGKAVYVNAVAVNSMTPQAREENLMRIKTIVTAYKPFVEEMWPLLENCPLAAVPGAKPKKRKDQAMPRPVVQD